jgi:hypothetical protein
MKTLKVLLVCLLLTGCIQSITVEPVARFQIDEQRTGNSGSQIACGVDHTGLGRVNYYEGVADDVLVIGHQTINANDRCRIDILTRLNGHVAFDLSELSASRSGSRQITSALLTARINSAPDFDGGCQTSTAGMLDNVFWLTSRQFYPETSPDLSNPPKSIRLTGLLIEDREVRLPEYLLSANPPVDVAGANRGAVTFSLDERSLSALQSFVDDGTTSRLRRFGLYFVGTNAGTTGTNQTCIQYFENIRLTVFFKDEP